MLREPRCPSESWRPAAYSMPVTMPVVGLQTSTGEACAWLSAKMGRRSVNHGGLKNLLQLFAD